MTNIVAREHCGEGSRLLGEADYILVAPDGGLSLDDVEALLTRELKRQCH